MRWHCHSEYFSGAVLLQNGRCGIRSINMNEARGGLSIDRGRPTAPNSKDRRVGFAFDT